MPECRASLTLSTHPASDVSSSPVQSLRAAFYRIDFPTDRTQPRLRGRRAGVQYVRAGNTTEGMINITMLKDGKAMR
jgi:hypothetical protein